MNGEKLSNPNAALADEAQQFAQNAVQQAANETFSAPKNIDDSVLHNGETVNVDHEQNKFENLSDQDLNQEATKKYADWLNAEADTTAKEDARNAYWEVVQERFHRYKGDTTAKPTVESAMSPDQKVSEEKESRLKNLRKSAVAKVAAGALAVVLAASGIMATAKMFNSEQANADPEIDNIDEQNKLQNHERAEVGSPESYLNKFANEDGSTYNQNKPGGLYSFAGEDVLGSVRGNEQASKEGIKDVSMQVETLSAYLNALGDKDRAELGIEGMTLRQINEKLENDDAFCKATSAKFLKMVDEGIIAYGNLEAGSYDNLYMDFIQQGQNASKENVEVVVCTTQENGTPVTILTTPNGSVLQLKDQCTQPVVKQGMWGSTIQDVPVKPDPGPIPPGPTPWGKEGDTHAGDGIFNKDLVNPATQVTEQESRHANDGNTSTQNNFNNNPVDQGGNQQQGGSADRGVDHTDQQEEQRIHDGDF